MRRILRQWRLDRLADEHACPDDVRRVFVEHVNSLYKLSFLLTGNRDDAERCFMAAVDDTFEGIRVRVPKHAIRSRAKRAIVEQAVRALKPRPHEKLERVSVPGNLRDRAYLSSGRQAVINRVLSLRVFERFVFVLCLLERQTVEECAQLLNCDVQEVLGGRMRALVSIVSGATALSPEK